jgi:hypothetical protein
MLQGKKHRTIESSRLVEPSKQKEDDEGRISALPIKWSDSLLIFQNLPRSRIFLAFWWWRRYRNVRWPSPVGVLLGYVAENSKIRSVAQPLSRIFWAPPLDHTSRFGATNRNLSTSGRRGKVQRASCRLVRPTWEEGVWNLGVRDPFSKRSIPFAFRARGRRPRRQLRQVSHPLLVVPGDAPSPILFYKKGRPASCPQF